MKKIFLFISLLIFTCLMTFSQTRNFKLVKTPTENPTTQKRKAIVIGMSNYGGGLSLNNTVNDANDMANVFTQLGFEVTQLTDNDYQSLETNLRNWYKTIEGNDMAIFYYAGHGVQVKGQNYLLPVDFPPEACEDDVKYKALNANQVVDNMDSKQVGFKLIILDACRNNPLKNCSSTRGIEVKGLANMNVPLGTYFIYSTAPGTEAQDGGDLKNGVFTYYFKQEILKKGASIDDIINATTLDVSKHTDRQQVPYKGGTLAGNYYFIPQNDGNPTLTPTSVFTSIPASAPVSSTKPAVDVAKLIKQADDYYKKKQYADALPLYIQAAEQGNAEAQYTVGYCYYNGQGETKDYGKAVDWFSKSVNQGNAAAKIYLEIIQKELSSINNTAPAPNNSVQNVTVTPANQNAVKYKYISNNIDMRLESCIRDGKSVTITYSLKNNTGKNVRLFNIGTSTQWCPNNDGEYTTVIDDLGNNYTASWNDQQYNTFHELAGVKKDGMHGYIDAVTLPNGVWVRGMYTIKNVNLAAKSFQVVNIAVDRYGGGNLCFDASYGFINLPITNGR